VLQKFSPHFKRWMSNLPYLAAVDVYARKVLELCALLQLPISQQDADAVITATCYGHHEEGHPSEICLATIEGLLYHHICGHVTAIGKTLHPHTLLCDQVTVHAFVSDFSKLLLRSAKFAEAKLTDAEVIFEDAVAMYVVCHVFAARVAEQFTRFTGVTGPKGSGVSTVFEAVDSIERKDGASVTKSILGQTIVRELPFTLPHLLMALNLFRAVSIVVVLEEGDCNGIGAVADNLEAMGTLCDTRRHRKLHVGVFISKLDECLSRQPNLLEATPTKTGAQRRGGRPLDEAAAIVAMRSLERLRSGSPQQPGWACMAAVAGAAGPRLEVSGMTRADFVEHAVAALRCMVMASNV
jgi:hypothetical protein